MAKPKHSRAQAIFLRVLRGERVPYRDSEDVQIQEQSKRALQNQGLVDYGRPHGSPVARWYLTTAGQIEADRLTAEATARQQPAKAAS